MNITKVIMVRSLRKTVARTCLPIDGGIRAAITALIEDGDIILQLGSGKGDLRLLKKYTLFCIEDKIDRIGLSKKINYVHAPLNTLPNSKVRWYDISILEKHIPSSYDLLLVNGPGDYYGRSGMLENLYLFKDNIPIIVANTIREHESDIAREIAFKMNRPLYTFWNFSVISPNLISRENVAIIQREAIRVLEQQKPEYISEYFTSHNTSRPIDRSEWHSKIRELRGDKNELKILKNSFSLKIGRFITYPFRITIGFWKK